MFENTKEMEENCVTLLPRDSAKFISQHSKNVFVNEKGVKDISSLVNLLITLRLFLLILYF